MRKERSEVKISPDIAYDISRYENVFVVLKENKPELKGRIWWSEGKQQYFLRGKIIKWLIMTYDEQQVARSYPLDGTISFVDHRDWEMYSTCQWQKKREEKIIHIPYSWIKHILLDFESLDWKR